MGLKWVICRMAPSWVGPHCPGHSGRDFEASLLRCVQVFTYLPVLTEGKQLLKAEAVCLLGNPALEGFHYHW